MRKIVVIGYDQGIANAGLCIMQYNFKTKKKTILEKQYFTTSAKLEEKDRIKMHFDFLMKNVEKYRPQAIACEKLMSNPMHEGRFKSAGMMTVNMISSIVMLVAAINKIEFKEYMPMTVKKHFTGFGKSTKDDMINMARKKYSLRKTPIEHVADAIGIADILIDDLIKTCNN